ncbi:MAG: hypothetical protein ACI4TM_00320 [Candidatus Cryptobacteroides sp.]
MSKIESSEDEEIVIDFSRTRFISPVFALSFLVFATTCIKRIRLINMTDYMKAFHMDNVIMPDYGRQSEFMAIMEGYSRKTYIPVISFPAQKDNDAKEGILKVIENLIIRQSNIKTNVATGLKYMIGETIDNITEHSESDRGFICAQAFQNKGYIDICIADRGITLLGSYKRLVGNEIESDIEAIQAANRGMSSKNLPEAENRGYGIYTSKKMLIEGLGGQYMIMSGGAVYMKSRDIDGFFTLPQNLRWDGTVVALRIPYQSPQFNYINYIE